MILGRQCSQNRQRAAAFQNQGIGAQGGWKFFSQGTGRGAGTVRTDDRYAKAEAAAGAVFHPGRRVEELVELDIAVDGGEGDATVVLERVARVRTGHHHRVGVAGQADHVAAHQAGGTDAQRRLRRQAHRVGNRGCRAALGRCGHNHIEAG